MKPGSTHTGTPSDGLAEETPVKFKQTILVHLLDGEIVLSPVDESTLCYYKQKTVSPAGERFLVLL